MTYLTLTNPNDTYILDIETDSLTPTLIWCVCIKNKGTKEVWKYTNPTGTTTGKFYDDLRSFFTERPEATFIGHNIISFDGYNLSRLCKFEWPYSQTIDSLVCSYLYNPALDGGHSLEAYGQRLKFPKGGHSDWSKYSEEMLEYCLNDVELTELVYDALTKKMLVLGFSELSCEIEHKIRVVIDKQQRNGFYFSRHNGEKLLHQLREREADLANQIHKLFPPELKEVGTYTKRLRKDGSNFASYERHVETHELVKDNGDGTYSCYDYSEFNIGSPKQRIERLLSVGFKPTAKTKKGNPRVDEDSLVAFSVECGRPEIKAMADWLVHNGRANMVENWLGYVGDDSRIHGRVFTCGATTRRMTHNSPNTANIPSGAKALYGHECRALWGVEPDEDLVLVGVDAAGLENVGLLHYLNNPKATVVLNRPKPDDIHSSNARSLTEALGRPVDREWGAKTTWYAWLYGAYPPKLGDILKGPPSDGDLVIKTFFKTVPGLKKLIDETQNEWSRSGGLIRTIDGGYVRCPGVNAALNYKVQSLGAIVMKLAAILLDEEAARIGLKYKGVGFIHDELQMECKIKDAEALGKLAVASITKAAEFLKFRVPLTGEYKIGKDWSLTH